MPRTALSYGCLRAPFYETLLMIALEAKFFLVLGGYVTHSLAQICRSGARAAARYWILQKQPRLWQLNL